MKLDNTFRRLLLVAADDSVESDLLAALKKSEVVQKFDGVFELAFFRLQRDADFLDILVLLNLLRDGFFEAVYLIPPAASWSRLRSRTTEGQLPLRSRAEPLGLSSLNPQQSERVRQSNREVEAVSWFAAQSARCKVRRVGLVLMFPEDLGGHVRDGPASPWSSREFQELESACDVRRGSAFLCQLASTDQRRPVGIITNLPTLQSQLSLQWPQLERHSDELVYRGPLPESCSCVPPHAPFRGTDAEEGFISSSSQSPSTNFWSICLADLDSFSGSSLRDGGGSIPSQQQSWVSSGFTFSFSSSSHSRASLFSHWMAGSLSRAVLSDFGSPGQVDRVFSSLLASSSSPWWSCFSSSPRVTPLSLCLSPSSLSTTASCSHLQSSSLPASSRSPLQLSSQSRLQLSSQLQSQPSLPGYTISSARGYARSRSPFRSLKSIARPPGTTKTPLVRMRPRGYTPHGYHGVGGGRTRATGASNGSVRTRLRRIFSVCPFVR